MSQKKALLPIDPTVGADSTKIRLIDVAQLVNDMISPDRPIVNNDEYKNVMKFEWAPASKFFIDYERQRLAETGHINGVDKRWKLHCVTPLQARYSISEDRFYVTDGQQHAINWIRRYGVDSLIPVFYIESEDIAVEIDQFLELNTGSKPVSQYDILRQRKNAGEENAVNLWDAVTAAGCLFVYKKYPNGGISNVGHIYKAVEFLSDKRKKSVNYKELTDTLTLMKRHWGGLIQTDTLRGLLNIRKLMRKANNGVLDYAVFEDILRVLRNNCGKNKKKEPCLRVFLKLVNSQCLKDLETTKNEAEDKMASAILSVYEQIKQVDVTNGNRPLKRLKMPVIKNNLNTQDTIIVRSK